MIPFGYIISLVFSLPFGFVPKPALLAIPQNVMEICDNGIDDDGDGLIDCFDFDCCSSSLCDDHYFNECPIECEFNFTSPEIPFQLEWESTGPYDWCSYNTPITGDIDGDGMPEVIGKPCTGTNGISADPHYNLLIVDGLTGMIENVISTPAYYYLMDAPAIADVDGNGFAEIFIQASEHDENATFNGGGPFISGNVKRKLLCYEYNGTNYVEKWLSTDDVGFNDDEQAVAPGIADFNRDGIPEVYLQTKIFNSLTGELLAKGSIWDHRGSRLNAVDDGSLAAAYVLAADILDDGACANCDGLELFAGGMVFSVHIDPSNPNNNQLNKEIELPGALDGWGSIADVDKDGDLDGVVTTFNGQDAFVYIWDLQTPTYIVDNHNLQSENGFLSQANIADFDGDGEVELGICTKDHYQVLKLNGNALEVLWSNEVKDWSGSTGSSVFDFNSDDVFEVVYRDEDTLSILDGATGIKLTTYPCRSGTRVEYPVVVDVDGDNETEILCSCENRLISMGSAGLPWIEARPVWNQHSFFNTHINDDLTVPIIQQQQHLVGDSVVMNNFLTMYSNPTFPAPDASVETDTITCNGDEFSITMKVCNIGNNHILAEVPITFYNGNPFIVPADIIAVASGNLIDIDEGECMSVSVIIPAIYNTEIFYIFNDEGTTTGLLSLSDFPTTFIGECNFENNIQNFELTAAPPPLNLGPDFEICDNGSATLSVNPSFERFEWSTGENTASIIVNNPGTYWVTGIFECHVITDTIIVSIDPVTILDLGEDIVICENGSTTITAQGFDSYQWSPATGLDCDNCATVVASPDSDITYTVTGFIGTACFSIDEITVLFDFVYAFDTLFLCNGESKILFGNEVSGNGIYTDTVYHDTSCDSVFTVTTIELEELSTIMNGTSSCADFNTGTITTSVNGGMPPYEYTWQGFSETASDLSGLGSGTYFLTVTDIQGCKVASSFNVGILSEVEVGISVQDVDCYDGTDGALIIDSLATGLTFSLDGTNFQSVPVFQNLSSGNYTLFIQDSLGCIHNDQEFRINEPLELSVDLAEEIQIIVGETTALEPRIVSFSDSLIYEWSPEDYLSCTDCVEPIAAPFFTTRYTLQITDDSGCTAVDEILVTIDRQRRIYIPNIFSPNADGLNDILMIYGNVGVDLIVDFRVFNRWGGVVFEAQNFLPNDNAYGWNGQYNNEYVNTGVYIYMVTIRFIDGQEEVFKGDVTVVR